MTTAHRNKADFIQIIFAVAEMFIKKKMHWLDFPINLQDWFPNIKKKNLKYQNTIPLTVNLVHDEFLVTEHLEMW